MWNSKTKKGFTVVEVMISMFLFEIFALFSFSITAFLLKSRYYDEKLYENTLIFEAVCANVENNISQYDANNYTQDNIYIDCSNIKIKNIKDTNVLLLSTKCRPLNSNAYAVIKINRDKITTITIIYHYKILKKENVMQDEIYKRI